MDPALGRFVSQDPKCDGVNWFVYCGNNPVNSIDADGKSEASDLFQEITAFALSALTCRSFQVSLAVMFLATFAAILAPVVFVVGSFVRFGGCGGGLGFAWMTAEAIVGMLQRVSAWPGNGTIWSSPGIAGATMEICNFIAGYASGQYSIMAADDAVQQLT